MIAWPFARQGRPDRIEPRLAGPPVETRRAGLGGIGIGTYGSSGVSNLNAYLAENVAAVTACVGVISSTIASLPARVYRNVDGGREEVTNHPVARLIREPCAALTWPSWLEMTVAQCLLFGNSLSVIDYDGAGRPIALRPVPWPFLQVVLLESGRLGYNVTQFIAPWGGSGLPRRYLDSEVLHILDRTNDGYLGVSRLARAPEVLEGALAVQAYTNSVWRNGASPSGFVKHPGRLNPEARKFLLSELTELLSGVHNARKLGVIDEGMSFEPVNIKLLDQETLETKRFSVLEICRIFQTPPPLIQAFENNSFTSAETASKWFAQLTLLPWIRKIEAAFGRSLFADSDMHLEIDVSGLMRGDFATRWASYQIAVQNKILTPDEVRETEGWAKLPDAPGEVVPGAEQ